MQVLGATMTKQGPSQLEAWLAAEAAQRARHAVGAVPGVIPRDRIRNLDGMAQMQGILSGEFPPATIAVTLDYLLIEVGPGRAVFQGTPGEAHLNPMGTVHGGWFATLLDSALGCAVHTTMPV